MNRQHFEFIKWQLAMLKDTINAEAFGHAEKAACDALDALDGDNVACHKNAAHNAGECAEVLLTLIARKYGIQLAKKDGPGGVFNKLSRKGLVIPKKIKCIFFLLQEYRNINSHPKAEESGDDELLMVLEAMMVALEWYVREVQKAQLNFDKVVLKANIRRYKELALMAFADGVVHPTERELLDRKAKELGLPPEIAEDIEGSILVQGRDAESELVQTMHVGNLHSATEMAKKRILAEFKKEGKVVCLNIALDMEITWPFFRGLILDNAEIRNFVYAGLIINEKHQSGRLSASWRDNIKHQVNNYKTFLDGFRNEMEQRDIGIKVKKNSSLPEVYGILINGKHLFWSFTALDDHGHITGANDFYYSNCSNVLGQNCVNAFADRFAMFWEDGLEIDIGGLSKYFKKMLASIERMVEDLRLATSV